ILSPFAGLRLPNERSPACFIHHLKEASMRISSRLFPLIALIALALLATPVRAGDAFDGKYKLHLEPDDQAGKSQKAFDDVMVFKADKMWVEGFKKKGFADAV